MKIITTLIQNILLKQRSIRYAPNIEEINPPTKITKPDYKQHKSESFSKGLSYNNIKIYQTNNSKQNTNKLKDNSESHLTNQDYTSERVLKYPLLSKTVFSRIERNKMKIGNIYYKGEIKQFIDKKIKNKLQLCIVGSRQATKYSQETLEEVFDYKLKDKLVMVNGLMSGVDTLSLHFAIKRKIPVIGVLPVGFMYLNKNQQIKANADLILNSGGVLISNINPEQDFARWTFAQRNKVMAGITDRLLILESRTGGGTFNMCSLGLNNNIHTATVPSNVTSELNGSNLLIKLGVHFITDRLDFSDFIYGQLGLISPEVFNRWYKQYLIESRQTKTSTTPKKINIELKKEDNERNQSEIEALIIGLLPIKTLDLFSKLNSYSVQDILKTVQSMKKLNKLVEKGGVIYVL